MWAKCLFCFREKADCVNAKRTFWYFSMVISGVSNQERGGAGGESQATQVSYNSWGENGKKEKSNEKSKRKKVIYYRALHG